MSQEHSAPFSSNLSHRLIIIFLILTLAVYAAGLTVTLKLRSNAVQDSQAAYLAQAEMFSDQLNNELTRISTQMKYTLTRSVTLWLSLAPNNTSFPQLYEFVLRMTDQIYSLQNTSSLIESTSVYFSELDMQNSPLHVPKYDHAVFASKALSRSKRQPFSVRATIFPFGE